MASSAAPIDFAAGDYYTMLGVTRKASEADIVKAYRTLALKYHPDKTGGKDEIFKCISEACSVLRDPEQRAEYDFTGGAGRCRDQVTVVEGSFRVQRNIRLPSRPANVPTEGRKLTRNQRRVMKARALEAKDCPASAMEAESTAEVAEGPQRSSQDEAEEELDSERARPISSSLCSHFFSHFFCEVHVI
eukprot:Skav211172  [mRNA]  locus=scaffold1363:226782:227348:- [translate_table: standard]